MAFEALKARIQSQQAEMRNPRYLNDLVADAQSIIRSDAPNLSGRMVRNLTTATETIETSDGLHAGLGDRSLVGSEDQPAPSGVIAQFLADHPEYKFGGERDQQDQLNKSKEGSSFIFEKRKAWAYLSEEAKTVLANARAGGDYGGGPSSPYFFQQEGSLDDWSKGAYPANITPTHFMQTALDEWRAEALPIVLADLGKIFSGG